MKYKGQFISMATILSLFFVTSSTVFGSQVTIQEFNKNLEFNSGDLSKITQTKLKVEAFESRAPKEVNFTVNNISVTATDWRGEPPGVDEAKSSYLVELSNVLNKQFSVLGCSGPSVESVELGDSLTEYKVDLTGESITCVSEATEVSLPTDLGDSFTVDHPKNRYVSALNYSSNYSRNLMNRLDEKEFSAKGSKETKSCAYEEGIDIYEGHTPRKYAEEEAKEEAKSKIKSEVRKNASKEFSNGNELTNDWIDENDAKNSLSVSIKGSCMSWERSSSDYTCLEGSDDEFSGTKYSRNCTLQLEEASISYSITNNENKITTTKGEVNPDFKWNYTYVD